jgi:hypothetical protein
MPIERLRLVALSSLSKPTRDEVIPVSSAL